MNNEALKAWLDAMPIDDVRRKKERLEAKLADVSVLERLYEDRHGASHEAAGEPEGEGEGEAAPESEGESPAEPSGGWQSGG